jgi:hypothetical protein
MRLGYRMQGLISIKQSIDMSHHAMLQRRGNRVEFRLTKTWRYEFSLFPLALCL